MRQPHETLLRFDIREIGYAVGRLEAQMAGFHFSGRCAEEIKALATRLENLCRSDKGHLTDGAVAGEMKDAA